MVHILDPLKINRPPNPSLRYWSPTSLEDFLRCPRGWYLSRTLRKKITLPALAKGTHTHSKLEELRLHKLRERARYKSAESYGNVIANDWTRGPIKTNSIRGDTILWESEQQKWIIREQIRKNGKRHHPILTEEEPPFLIAKKGKKQEVPPHKRYTTTHRFKFIWKGHGFSGEIDELRPNKTVRDYKTGRSSYIKKALDTALQPTYYLLRVCNICNVSEEFREKFGVTEKEAKHWAGNPEFIGEKVKFEYYLVDPITKWDKEKKEFLEQDCSPIIKTSRSDSDYKELCQLIDTANIMLSHMQDQGTYPSFRKTCMNCSLYKEECERMTDRYEDQRQLSLLENITDTPRFHPETHCKSDYEETQIEFEFMENLKKSAKD